MVLVSKYELAVIGAQIEMARRHFWDYCNLKAGDFYKFDRGYLKTLCDTLENFPSSDKKVLLVDMPPRLSPWKEPHVTVIR